MPPARLAAGICGRFAVILVLVLSCSVVYEMLVLRDRAQGSALPPSKQWRGWRSQPGAARCAVSCRQAWRCVLTPVCALQGRNRGGGHHFFERVRAGLQLCKEGVLGVDCLLSTCGYRM